VHIEAAASGTSWWMVPGDEGSQAGAINEADVFAEVAEICGFRADFAAIQERVRRLQPWLDEAHLKTDATDVGSSACRDLPIDGRAQRAPEPLQIEPATTTLLINDMQNAFCSKGVISIGSASTFRGGGCGRGVGVCWRRRAPQTSRGAHENGFAADLHDIPRDRPGI